MSECYKGLPRYVMIGHYRFRMVVSNGEKYPVQLGESDGYTDLVKLRIYLREDLNWSRAIDVVQHELTHAINWVGGVTDESDEEEFTELHSRGLVTMWTTNPKVFAWFGRSLRMIKKEDIKDDDAE